LAAPIKLSSAAWTRRKVPSALILRHKLGSIKVALSPEQLQELAALYPPEPPHASPCKHRYIPAVPHYHDRCATA
jgi:hypothetical protein